MPIIWGEGARQRLMGQKSVAAQYERKKYLQRKRLGLCPKCGRKASVGRTKCDVCRTKINERWKALHPVVCGECKLPIESKERVVARRFHKSCAEKRRARRHLLQHRSAARAYQKRHRAMGLCLKCPLKAFRSGFCQRHYRMAKERTDRAAGRI